jgi:hypothetical protein
VVGSYGTACTIGFINGSRTEHNFTDEQALINAQNFELIVYPNPFNEQASMLLHAPANDKVQIQIYDITGKVIWDEQVNPNQKTVIGQQLAKGNYIIKAIFIDGSQQIERLIKVE